MATPRKRQGAAPAPAPTPTPAPAPAPVAAKPAPKPAERKSEERKSEEPKREKERSSPVKQAPPPALPGPTGSFAQPTATQRQATTAKALGAQTASRVAQETMIAAAPAAGPLQPYGEIEAEYYAPSISARPAEGQSVFGLEPYLKAVEQVARLRREGKVGPVRGHVVEGAPLRQSFGPYISERTPVTVKPKQEKPETEIYPWAQEVRSPSAEALERPLIAAMELKEIDRQRREVREKFRDTERRRTSLEDELKAAKQRVADAVTYTAYTTSAEREALRQKMNAEIVQPIEAQLKEVALLQRRRERLRAALEASRREYGMTPDIEEEMMSAAQTPVSPEAPATKQ